MAGNMDKGKLGVAIIGLGVGEQHARAFAESRDCEIRWLCDFDLKRANLLRDDLRCQAGITDNIQIALDDPGVDIVSIASFDDHHYEQVVDCMKAGKHVFVEKPLCRNLAELSHIKKVWASHKGELKLRSNLLLRAAPLYRWLKEQLESSDFGDVYAFDGEYLYGRLSKLTEGWRKEIFDYSVMEGGGIHLVDLMIWLTGQRPTRVFASGNRICTEGTEFRYNDYMTTIMHFPSGLIGRITANFGCVHRHHHVMRIYGTDKTFFYDDAGPRIHVSRDSEIDGTRITLDPLTENKGVLIGDFLDSIVKGRNTSKETQEMFDVVSICAASDESEKYGNVQKIQYV